APTPSEQSGAAALETFQKLLKNPMFAKFASRMSVAVQDPSFMKAAGEIAKNKNKTVMYATIILYTILFALMRRAAMSSTDRFLPRLIMQVLFMLTFFCG